MSRKEPKKGRNRGILDYLVRIGTDLHKPTPATDGTESLPELEKANVSPTTRRANVAFTEAFQSYDSAGDEAEPYCEECEMDALQDNFKYCPGCGSELNWDYEEDEQ